MKKSNIFLKALSLVLIILCISPLLVSCKGRALAQSGLAKKEVGKVGSYSVPYEEFYFVASNYYSSMKAQYGDDTEGLKKAVWDKAVKALASNYYATLALCEAEGIKYDPRDLQDEIDDIVEKRIEANYDGSRSDYLKSQQEVGLTYNYDRFTIGVDIMYNRLLRKYQETDVVPTTDENIKSYIKDNFIHTWHIAVIVNENEDRDEELKKAEGFLSRLNNGESFYSLMKYSEDFASNNLSGAEGTYFYKGEMTKEYEDASLALKMYDHSDIVASTARQEDGPTLECFYIIERLPVKEEEIDKNFDVLSSKVTSAIISQKLESTKASLSFEPNEYAKSLDVTNLKQPKNGIDYQVILIIVACILCCAIIVTLVIISRKMKLKKFNQLKINK